MELRFSAATDQGPRSHNEDSYLVDSPLSLFIVADGMGGRGAGEVASQLTCEVIAGSLRDEASKFAAYAKDGGPRLREELLHILQTAVNLACAKVFERSQQQSRQGGMGSTLSLLVIAGQRGFIAHVGDSRIYLLRDDNLHQLTEDHTIIEELRRQSGLSLEEIEKSPMGRFKNSVTRSIGTRESVHVDTFDFEVAPGDCFLLCTDGIPPFLQHQQLPELYSKSLATMPDTIIQMAKRAAAADNLTVIAVRLDSDRPPAVEERALDLANRIDALKRIPLFRLLAYKEIIHFLNVMLVQRYEAGDIIVRENSDGDALFVLLSGKVRVTKANKFITQLEPGAHFGEMALIGRNKRTATVLSEEPSRFLALSRADFNEILRQYPLLASKLLWSLVETLAERLQKTTAELSDRSDWFPQD